MSEPDYVREPCPCREGDDCPHYGRRLNGRVWQLSRESEDYRREWVRQVLARAAPPASAGQVSVTLPAQAVALALALGKWIAAGRPRPTPEQFAARSAACAACPHLARAQDKTRCPLCGCFLAGEPILLGTVERPGKLEMGTETCPDNPPRWGPTV